MVFVVCGLWRTGTGIDECKSFLVHRSHYILRTDLPEILSKPITFVTTAPAKRRPSWIQLRSALDKLFSHKEMSELVLEYYKTRDDRVFGYYCRRSNPSATGSGGGGATKTVLSRTTSFMSGIFARSLAVELHAASLEYKQSIAESANARSALACPISKYAMAHGILRLIKNCRAQVSGTGTGTGSAGGGGDGGTTKPVRILVIDLIPESNPIRSGSGSGSSSSSSGADDSQIRDVLCSDEVVRWIPPDLRIVVYPSVVPYMEPCEGVDVI